jgi:hypothetical protein
VEISVQFCVVGWTNRTTKNFCEFSTPARPRHTGTSPRAVSDDSSCADGTQSGNAMAGGTHRKAAMKAAATT